MEYFTSDTYPEVHYTDETQTSYQSQLLLMECSDGGFELGFLVGPDSNSGAKFVNKRFQDVKCLAWGYVVHSEFYGG